MYEPIESMENRVRQAEPNLEAVRKFLALVPNEPEVVSGGGPFQVYFLKPGVELTQEAVDRAVQEDRTFENCFDEIMERLLGEDDTDPEGTPRE